MLVAWFSLKFLLWIRSSLVPAEERAPLLCQVGVCFFSCGVEPTATEPLMNMERQPHSYLEVGLSFATFVSWLLVATDLDLRLCSSSWNNSFFPWLWFTWGRDSTLGSTLEAGSVNLGREICALWLRIQIYLSFIITRGQKLILGAKSPFINNFIKSAFIIK